jgi:hypothetical protein
MILSASSTSRPAHAKLAATKAAYDPDNVFRRNHNVQPAASLAGQ